ncbi:MAG: deoxyhypusine synthase family protein, partial [Oceanicaulis sp.]
SSSTLKEACSWGKVDVALEQMVYAEATTVAPVIVSDVFHRGAWKNRPRHRYGDMFED